MKLSELISKLSTLRAEHGDIEVVIPAPTGAVGVSNVNFDELLNTASLSAGLHDDDTFENDPPDDGDSGGDGDGGDY